MASLTSQGLIKEEAKHDVYYDNTTYSSGSDFARCQVWAGPSQDDICHGFGYFVNSNGMNTVLIFKGEVIKVSRIRDDMSIETFTCHDNSCENWLGPWTNSDSGNKMYKGDSDDPLA